jgi:hypothetical protein
MKTIATIIAAVLSFVLQGTFAAHAANASGHCTGMTVTDFLSSDAVSGTTSPSWVNVTDGFLNFTTSGTGCVMITFSGHPRLAPVSGHYQSLYVRTLLDGSSLCVPALSDDTFLEAVDPPPLIAASITHICKNVAAGTHSVQVQFVDEDSGGSTGAVSIHGHVLTVTHN